MISQPGLHTIELHILPSISQSKGNQWMKFDQLIKYNKRNIQVKHIREQTFFLGTFDKIWQPSNAY